MKNKHPVQPLEFDEKNVLRFKENSIVRFLLDNGPHDLNTLNMYNFSNEDMEQLWQLIGVSLSLFGDLDFVSDETYERAVKEYNKRKGIKKMADHWQYAFLLFSIVAGVAVYLLVHFS